MGRIVNFNAGPAGLPTEVLEEVQAELLDYDGTGLSIMEASHRGADFDAVHNQAQSLLLELLGAPDGVKVLFLQGGASTQFTMLPMNFLGADQSADYVNTGAWSKKAIKEAERYGKVNVAGSTADDNFNHLPALDALTLDPNARYCHITTNNTIFGTQWPAYPDTKYTGTEGVPLICDMSSDILSRPFDWSNIAMIYGGAQKNLGPSGLTVVLMRESFYETSATDAPTMLSYRTHWESNSLFNTPPTFAIYILKKVLEWVKRLGGMPAMEARNREKAAILYGFIDDNDDFYTGTVTDKAHRSWMNVTFRLPSEDLEKQFITEALEAGFCGLKGHRSVGGCRASTYNAVSPESIRLFVDFMAQFKESNA